MNQQFASEDSISLSGHKNLFVRQIFETAELFGFETRNKYAIMDENKNAVAYAAEQQKGFWGFIVRQFLGHWRRFDIIIFNLQRQPVWIAKHPWRFFFQRLEIYNGQNQMLGALQQRWAIFRKRFDVEDHSGNIIMQVSSPWFRFWTFPFMRGGTEVARVEKQWTGIFAEMFSDKDTFHVGFGNLNENERKLILAASLFIDLQYFEASGGQISLMGGFGE